MFKKLFGKGAKTKAPKGFYELTISAIRKLTDDTVEVSFDIPKDQQSFFAFTPGQYINVAIDVNDQQERRSYSICSGPNSALSVAVKKVANGKVSKWFNETAEVGMPIFVSPPEGNFVRPKEAKNIVAIAVGSGITPILAMAKAAEGSEVRLQLLYGSRTLSQVIFRDELATLNQTQTTHYLSGESADGCVSGRIDKESFTAAIKNNLELLKSDGFFICGPESMIVDIVAVLKNFGVSDDKVYYELFTTPTLLASKSTADTGTSFSGMSKVTVILDDESVTFDLASDGSTILDRVNKEGLDAPYSCKGGVCSTCKAKILEGNARMTVNYSLTDRDIEDGYILTCQSHPTSETLKITYDV